MAPTTFGQNLLTLQCGRSTTAELLLKIDTTTSQGGLVWVKFGMPTQTLKQSSVKLLGQRQQSNEGTEIT